MQLHGVLPAPKKLNEWFALNGISGHYVGCNFILELLHSGRFDKLSLTTEISRKIYAY